MPEIKGRAGENKVSMILNRSTDTTKAGTTNTKIRS